MARTTLEVDTAVLERLRAAADLQHMSLEELLSDIASRAPLPAAADPAAKFSSFWPLRSVGIRVDLTDKEAVQALLDAED